MWRAGADIQSAALAPCAGCGPRVVENTPDPDEASSSFVIEWAEWLTRLQTKEDTRILRQGRVMGRLSDSPGHRPKTEPMGRCSDVDPLLLGAQRDGTRVLWVVGLADAADLQRNEECDGAEIWLHV